MPGPPTRPSPPSEARFTGVRMSSRPRPTASSIAATATGTPGRSPASSASAVRTWRRSRRLMGRWWQSFAPETAAGRRRARSAVPVAQDPHVAFEAQAAYGGGVEAEAAGEARRLLYPAGADDAQDVAVGDEGDVAVDGQGLGDDAVGAGAHVVGRLAVGHAVAPQVPARSPLADLRRRDALVVAVVVLEQLVAHLGVRAQAGELGRLPRARQRADEHRGEARAAQLLGQRRGARPARLGQRDVGAARVLAGLRPLGLGVADEPDLGRHGL